MRDERLEAVQHALIVNTYYPVPIFFSHLPDRLGTRISTYACVAAERVDVAELGLSPRE